MEALKSHLQTFFGTIAILCALTFILYNAYHLFEGWAIVGAIIGQIAILVFLAYIIRWVRYPGLFQSKSSARLLREYLMGVFTFSGGLIVLALLAYIHVLYFLKLDYLGEWLGLEFRFKKGKTATVSRAASHELRPGSIGRIVSTRVVQQDEVGPSRIDPPGTVYYTLLFDDGSSMEVPERELF